MQLLGGKVVDGGIGGQLATTQLAAPLGHPGNQGLSQPAPARSRLHIYPFQIDHRAALAAVHVIAAQGRIGKGDRLALRIQHQKGVEMGSGQQLGPFLQMS
ncbi:hypothetical protein LCEOLIKB_01659 [Aeromonas hydrophila]